MVFELTPSEEAVLVKRGAANLPVEFVYCQHCWNIIKDPQAGPRLMRDAAERQMLRLGVAAPRAQAAADRYYSKLVQLQRERHHRVH